MRLRNLHEASISSNTAGAATQAGGGSTNIGIIQKPQEPQNVRVSGDWERGFRNMSRAVSNILADETALITPINDKDVKEYIKEHEKTFWEWLLRRKYRFKQKAGQFKAQAPWGEIFNIARSENSPKRGKIELEYQEQAGRTIFGDILWSLGYIKERPGRVVLEKLGLVTNPERFYADQFWKELRNLAAKDILVGLEEWTIRTGIPGRNILIAPKSKRGKPPRFRMPKPINALNNLVYPPGRKTSKLKVMQTPGTGYGPPSYSKQSQPK